MPVHGSDAFHTSATRNGDLDLNRPNLLTPPPDGIEPHRRIQAPGHRRMTGEDVDPGLAVSDNTAAGMSMRQEDTLYLGSHSILDATMIVEKDCANADALVDDPDAQTEKPLTNQDYVLHANSPELVAPNTPISIDGVADNNNHGGAMLYPDQMRLPSPVYGAQALKNTTRPREPSNPAELLQDPSPRKHLDGARTCRIDDQFDLTCQTRPWDFTNRRVEPKYPCSIFRPFAKFAGSQQSDRQVYNVEVTILTVDMDQATTSGYLQICGLTPDHPTLTTFFTGEIIGGPEQRFSFRTRDPDWGTSDKVDLTHWARFPAFRPLKAHAKADLDFTYPTNQENWWQQDNIFMRWKEHFLVPDHKLKSIQGASFEGFYYICFNQIEGRISGIYFHSRSEKYQQLELKHEGSQGVWAKGVCPSVELR